MPRSQEQKTACPKTNKNQSPIILGQSNSNRFYQSFTSSMSVERDVVECGLCGRFEFPYWFWGRRNNRRDKKLWTMHGYRWNWSHLSSGFSMVALLRDLQLRRVSRILFQTTIDNYSKKAIKQVMQKSKYHSTSKNKLHFNGSCIPISKNNYSYFAVSYIGT
ncbi:hypothetical protein WA026_018980 [Henosepilachna vigintioctopunctata]|uniref:Uncharacterized protein n=1 Tax=Henosepilachna vigintioctopunctata TaxID=420089 RepID=A0AAW1UGI9_9CUCU